jgi:hypothetical protein
MILDHNKYMFIVNCSTNSSLNTSSLLDICSSLLFQQDKAHFDEFFSEMSKVLTDEKLIVESATKIHIIWRFNSQYKRKLKDLYRAYMVENTSYKNNLDELLQSKERISTEFSESLEEDRIDKQDSFVEITEKYTEKLVEPISVFIKKEINKSESKTI